MVIARAPAAASAAWVGGRAGSTRAEPSQVRGRGSADREGAGNSKGPGAPTAIASAPSSDTSAKVRRPAAPCSGPSSARRRSRSVPSRSPIPSAVPIRVAVSIERHPAALRESDPVSSRCGLRGGGQPERVRRSLAAASSRRRCRSVADRNRCGRGCRRPGGRKSWWPPRRPRRSSVAVERARPGSTVALRHRPGRQVEVVERRERCPPRWPRRPAGGCCAGEVLRRSRARTTSSSGGGPRGHRGCRGRCG